MSGSSVKEKQYAYVGETMLKKLSTQDLEAILDILQSSGNEDLFYSFRGVAGACHNARGRIAQQEIEDEVRKKMGFRPLS